MLLSFRASHLSITSFPDVELPAFTLITGLNGTGKSHLLQALVRGAIFSSAAPQQSSNHAEVRLFDWNSIVPQDTGPFSSEQLSAERLNLSQRFSQITQSHAHVTDNLRRFAKESGLPNQYVTDLKTLVNLDMQNLRDLGKDDDQARQVLEIIRQQTVEADQGLWGQFNVQEQNQLDLARTTFKKPIFALTSSEILSPALPNWGQADLFQQSFARLFVSYRNLKLENDLATLRKERDREENSALSVEEFEKQHGPPPWDFVNSTLQHAGLGFEINAPSLGAFTAYQPELTKRTSGTPIAFSNLSSGEKVLMSFAFCVYYSSDRRQMSVYPKLLLLDEVDAPLHPSMSKNLIDTIISTLVGQFNINVIATTHSPSTVAIAPDNSIYVMKPGLPGLHKNSKAEALNVLTIGVPTLAISFEGRRQVFVESPADAATYDALYRLLKARLASEMSLEFIATGTKNAKGIDQNTGCDAVKRIVGDLIRAGNMSVFGLLDWDAHNQPQNRIHVLGEGERNGLENALFDPLLICGLIARDGGEQDKAAIGLTGAEGYIQFLGHSPERCQELCDRLTQVVMNESAAGQKLPVRYLGGMRLQISKAYLFADDHELEQMLLARFPFLNQFARGKAGNLLQHVIATVLTDNREFCPNALFTLLHDLLAAPSH